MRLLFLYMPYYAKLAVLTAFLFETINYKPRAENAPKKKSMENNKEIQIQFVPIELLEYNEGQIPGVPENPRTREDAKQRSLEKSIEELPEMTIARAALCYPYNGRYVVIGGNRRLEAQRALKRKEVLIIALPENTPVDKLRRIALLDNESAGQTDWNKLAKEWDKEEIKAWNIETPEGWGVNADDFGEKFSLPSGNKEPFQQMTFTFADEQAKIIKEVIKDAKCMSEYGVMENYGNLNSNGNALYLICKQWAEQKR